jgi:hypothetical protein
MLKPTAPPVLATLLVPTAEKLNWTVVETGVNVILNPAKTVLRLDVDLVLGVKHITCPPEGLFQGTATEDKAGSRVMAIMTTIIPAAITINVVLGHILDRSRSHIVVS